MPARDPFQRKWFMAPTYLLGEPKFYRLSLGVQGVFWAVAALSLRDSLIPGYLLDRDGKAMSEDDIADNLRADVVHVKAALQALREAQLMQWSRTDGWAFAERLYDEMLAECNRTAKREAEARRARAYRARKKAADPDRAKVVDLDARRDAEGANQ